MTWGSGKAFQRKAGKCGRCVPPPTGLDRARACGHLTLHFTIYIPPVLIQRMRSHERCGTSREVSAGFRQSGRGRPAASGGVLPAGVVEKPGCGSGRVGGQPATRACAGRTEIRDGAVRVPSVPDSAGTGTRQRHTYICLGAPGGGHLCVCAMRVIGDMTRARTASHHMVPAPLAPLVCRSTVPSAAQAEEVTSAPAGPQTPRPRGLLITKEAREGCLTRRSESESARRIGDHNDDSVSRGRRNVLRVTTNE